MGKADKTRQYIIEQTAPVFNRKGIAGTSLSDLTEITGLTKGSIYGNFRNKDEVAIAAFEYNLQKIVEGLGKELQKESTYTGRLLAHIRFYRNFHEDQILRLGCPIMNTATEADDTHPALKEKVSEAIIMWDSSLQKLIRKGIEAQEFKNDIDPPAFSARMISLIEGGVLLSKSTGSLRFLHESLNMLEYLINEISLKNSEV